jgi:hypothetical protein
VKTFRSILILMGLALTGVIICLFLGQPIWWFHWQDYEKGNQIISRVELFRAAHKRLPETLEEIGFDDPDTRVYYQKVSADEYWVWFAITVGEAATYSSSEKKWEFP